jgi:hypothetical protein
VIALTPVGAALALAALIRSRFDRRIVAAALALSPLLVLAAPSKTELLVTVAVEAPVVWGLARVMRIDAWRAVVASGFVNALTQPLLVVGTRLAPPTALGWTLALAPAELGVWAVEALLYLACLETLRRGPRALVRALGLSLAANAASALVGLALPI